VTEESLNIPRDELEAFCRRHHIRRLALFGSVVRGEAGPGSDLDVLVEFDTGHVPGLAFFTMQDELSRLFGRNVDLNTPQFLNPAFREEVQQQAEVQYEQ
jgi:predicted nucleotidyltransferase